MVNEMVELLEVIKCGPYSKVRCKCKLCGNEFVMWRSHYYRGSTECKCLGVTNHRIYSIFTNMKTRCYNPHSRSYKDYGARGIHICDEWANDYLSFEKWALNNGYSDELTIERIDVNGDYCPNNCTWASSTQQQRNKRTTRRIGGTSLRNYCTLHGINYKTFHSYLRKHPELTLEEIANRYKGGRES